MSDGIVGAIAISLFGSEKKRRDSMDAGYTILGNDVDVCRMFDQFSYKRNEALDFSLNIPQHHHSTSYHHAGYAMADQTFHTPSFGDEDFDIPTIHPHSHQQHQQQQQQQQQQHQQQSQPAQQQQQQQQQTQHDPMHSYQTQMMQTGSVQQSPDGLNLDPGGYQQSLYLQQEHSMQPISVSSTYSNSQGSYASMSSPRQQHGNQQIMLLQQQQQQHQQQQQQAQMQQHMQYMHSQQQQQQQQQMQQQMQYRSPTGGSPSAIQPSSIPEANNNTTTSEDSDDSTPHSAMITGIKRPSPEPADVAAKNQRKPKSQKKKKKRDPNEPQKPVSAYALFFRDTQAAIKGQNPNASFGEVSKIVASMWDALETEHKNVYKKKTEAAKKEYLQALAAYRASLVSKGAAENEQQHQQQQQQQSQQQPSSQQQQVQYAAYGNYTGNGAPATVSYQVYSPQPQPPSPQQQHPHPHPHQQQLQHHQQSAQQMQIKKSPHHLTMPGNPQQQQTQQTLITTPMAQAHISQQQQQQSQQQQHMQQQVSQQYMQMPQQQVQQVQQHHQQQQQQQQQQMIHAANAGKSDSLSSPPAAVNSTTQGASMAGQRATSNACIRHGCPNPAVANSEWEDEYCSNECVVSHCRDVFTTWVSSNQNPQQNFSTVK